MGILITKCLLPLLHVISVDIPISVPSLFASWILRSYDLPKTVNCSHLALSDYYYHHLNQL